MYIYGFEITEPKTISGNDEALYIVDIFLIHKKSETGKYKKILKIKIKHVSVI